MSQPNILHNFKSKNFDSRKKKIEFIILHYTETLNLQDGTIVTFIPTGSTIVGQANADYGSSVSASGGNGSGATFSVTRDAQGVSAVQVTDGGGLLMTCTLNVNLAS